MLDKLKKLFKKDNRDVILLHRKDKISNKWDMNMDMPCPDCGKLCSVSPVTINRIEECKKSSSAFEIHCLDCFVEMFGLDRAIEIMSAHLYISKEQAKEIKDVTGMEVNTKIARMLVKAKLKDYFKNDNMEDW